MDIYDKEFIMDTKVSVKNKIDNYLNEKIQSKKYSRDTHAALKKLYATIDQTPIFYSKALEEVLEKAYQDGYDKGYDKGYDEGRYNEGYGENL